MNWRVDLSKDAQKQILKLPREVQSRVERAINEFETEDESRWTNVKALQGSQWKGYYRKRLGDYRIIFEKSHNHGIVEISAVLVKSKDTYR